MSAAPILYFFVTIAVTLLITAWAAQAGSSRESLYAASSRLSGMQNGLALAGDTMSAGTILGIVGLYLVAGVDVAYFSVPSMAGFCLLLIFIVKPLRQLGRYTLGDVVASRFVDPRLRIVLGVCVVTVSLIYLVAQLVGAGALISLVFGLKFNVAVTIVGVLMAVYVSFGGMLAASWVQIIKAVLLIAMVGLLAALALRMSGGLGDLYVKAAARLAAKPSVFAFGTLDLSLFSSVSLLVTGVLGTIGMPHVLIRFFTVPDAQTAKQSMVIATTLIGAVMIMIILVIGPATLAFDSDIQGFRDSTGAVVGGPNMVAMHLVRFLGGDVLFGTMSAVIFATILAVVAGLTVAISSATSHDLVAAIRARPLGEKAEVVVFRVVAAACSAVAVGLAIVFQNHNLSFLLVMASSVAGSTTFPLLVLAIYWPRLTAEGAIACGVVGLVVSVGLIVLGPACWVQVLGFVEPVFPSDHPVLVSTPLAFAAGWLVSRQQSRSTMTTSRSAV